MSLAVPHSPGTGASSRRHQASALQRVKRTIAVSIPGSASGRRARLAAAATAATAKAAESGPVPHGASSAALWVRGQAAASAQEGRQAGPLGGRRKQQEAAREQRCPAHADHAADWWN